jgi:hypothetical protein
MSNYLETDFCQTEEGLDYIFGRMSAIYGAAFLRHWEGVDHNLVRQEWANQLGRFLTYRPSMDFAISKLNEEFVPSAIKFRNLCNQGPDIPVKPTTTTLLERKMTIHEQIESDRIKAEALAKLAEMKKQYGGRT